MKQIPQRIINDVEEGWMRSIEVSREELRANTFSKYQ